MSLSHDYTNVESLSLHLELALMNCVVKASMCQFSLFPPQLPLLDQPGEWDPVKEREQCQVHQKVSHTFPPAKLKCQAQGISCPPNLWLTRDSSISQGKPRKLLMWPTKLWNINVYQYLIQEEEVKWIHGSWCALKEEPSAGLHICNSSTCEVQAEGWCVPGKHRLHSETLIKQTNSKQENFYTNTAQYYGLTNRGSTCTRMYMGRLWSAE